MPHAPHKKPGGRVSLRTAEHMRAFHPPGLANSCNRKCACMHATVRIKTVEVMIKDILRATLTSDVKGIAIQAVVST